ncbi:MAG TPA: hypothetical protein VKA46_09030 [Gemmataceae bacterium]|nr:hypothetical protein [Gemmataceae bacterium]
MAGPAGERPLAPEARRLDLWNSYALPLALCALLGVEWLVRLLKGYV